MVIPAELHQKLKEHDEKSGKIPLETWGWHQVHWNPMYQDYLRYAELLGNGGLVVDLFRPMSWKPALRLCVDANVSLGLGIHPCKQNDPDPRVENAASRTDRHRIKEFLKRFADEIGADQVARIFIDAETYHRDPRGVDDPVAWNRAMTGRHNALYALISETFACGPSIEWYGRNPVNKCCTLRELPFQRVASRSLYEGKCKENKKQLIELIRWSLAADYESVSAWISIGCRYDDRTNKWEAVSEPSETWRLADWIRKAQLTARLHRVIDYLAFSDIEANVNYPEHWAAWQLGIRGLPMEE